MKEKKDEGAEKMEQGTEERPASADPMEESVPEGSEPSSDPEKVEVGPEPGTSVEAEGTIGPTDEVQQDAAKEEGKEPGTGPSPPESEVQDEASRELKGDDGHDPLKDFEILTRKQVVEGLVLKHQGLVESYGKEIEDLDIRPKEIVDAKEGERSIRDRINEEVQSLKSKRKELRDRNKKLRSEFFDLLEREERLKGHRKEVEMYSNFSKDLEWKLETEAITIDNERRLLDELRETIEKMRSITDGYTPEEIKARLNDIQEEIGNNLLRIEELHSSLLERVDESNVHHEKYVDAHKQIRERESRRGWLKRRIELHKEMETFWRTQLDQAEKLDSEESERKIEDVRATLLEAFKQREKEDQKEEEQASKTEGPKERKERPRERRPRKERQPKVENGPEPASGDVKTAGGEKHDGDGTPVRNEAKEPPKEDVKAVEKGGEA